MPRPRGRRCSLRARQRLCLSGTPLENHLGELWSLFDFLAPGFLGNARSFRSRYRTPIEKHGDAERQAALHRRVRPFLLRRTKEEVATELPPKTEITEPVEMEAPQRAVYEAIRLSMHARVKQAVAEKGLARVRHHHPGCAAEAAPGLLRPAAAGDEVGAEGRLGQAGAAAGAARASCSTRGGGC